METSKIKKKKINETGQALVEFALIAGVLLAFIFVVLEAGRIFQAWVTVQNAARNAGRYAVTGQYNDSGVFNTPECPVGTPTDRWQVCSVKDEALRTGAGLSIDPGAAVNDPAAFGTQVCRPDDCPPENVGLPGEPTRVRVFYNVEVITPFFRPIARFIRVTGQVEVVVENYDQISPNEIVIKEVESGGTAPPLPNVADLRISKSDNLDPVNVRETVVYSLTVVNDGPFGTPSVQVIDILPSGTVSVTAMTVTDGTNPIVGATCSLNSLDWQVACVIPYLEGGSGLNTAIVNISTHLDPVELHSDPSLGQITVTNNASVFNAIATTDPDISNNSTTEDTTVKSWVDLELIKSHVVPPNGSFYLGQQVEYNIQVQNFGPNTVQSPTVTDPLPAGLDFQSASSPDGTATCSNAGNVVNCTLVDLAENETGTIQISATAVQSNTLATQTNTAVVASPPNELDDIIGGWHPTGTVDNEDSVDSPIKSPILIVSKEKEGDGPGIVDDVMFYLITVQNVGDGLAKDVVITDTLYADGDLDEVWYLSAVLLEPGNPEPCVTIPPDNYHFTCALGDMLGGTSKQLRVKVMPNVTHEGMPNSVLARSNSGLIEASTTITTPIEREFDLEVTKSGPEVVDIDDIDSSIKYTIAITNHGPSMADFFTVDDYLELEPDDPDMIKDISLSIISGNFDCTVANSKLVINCEVTDLSNVPSSNVAEIEVNITPALPGIINNTVTAVDTVTGGADSYPDSANVITQILPYADLEMDKDPDYDLSDLENGILVYRLRVDNHGPSTAENLVISDTVTVGTITGITMTHESNANSIVCDTAAGGSAPITVSCALNSLGQTMDDGKATGVDPAIYFVTITYTDTVGEKLTDSAEVTSTTFDPGPYHNVEEETEENLDNKLAILIAYPESQYYASFDSRLLLRNQFQ